MRDSTIDEMMPAQSTQPYEARRLSYATTFQQPLKANTIRAIEWMTGKLTLLRLIRGFEREGVPKGQAFWSEALRHMGIEVRTPEHEIRRIPREGPVVLVANHPHGLVDGMVLAELMGRVRQDYKILVRSLLTGVPEVAHFLIPVPFAHEPDALDRNLEARRRAMRQLAEGGAVILFPAGGVAAASTAFGRAEEGDWSPFTAKLIQRSKASVVPVRFPGQNSRWYQIANRISPTLRQGLLLHEVVHTLNAPQRPVVGEPVPYARCAEWAGDPRGFMAWLRDRTLSLAP